MKSFITSGPGLRLEEGFFFSFSLHHNTTHLTLRGKEHRVHREQGHNGQNFFSEITDKKITYLKINTSLSVYLKLVISL